MVMTVSIDNQLVSFCLFKEKQLTATGSMAADLSATADQYIIQLRGMMDFHQISWKEIQGAIISCVVPSLLPVVTQALERLISGKVMSVCSGMKTGLNIKLDNLVAVGSDFVCNSVAALDEFKPPAVIISLGAATTFTALDRDGALVGRSIMPGVEVSLRALRESSVQLPLVFFDEKAKLLGKNTVDAMKSGIFYGTVSMVEGMAARYMQALGGDVTLIGTGDAAASVLQSCNLKVTLRQNLIHQGLYLLYMKNK